MKAADVQRQRSTTSRNWQCVPQDKNREVHRLAVGDHDVGVALCGEAFNRDVRTGLVDADVALVVVPAHTAAGSRHSCALKYFADHGKPALRAVHANEDARNVLWVRKKEVSPIASERLGKAPWAKVSVFEIQA
jgi:hypothetical protein